eukprot:78055-Amphidinium_carterae.1
MKVYRFWRLVGPQLRERPEAQPKARLPAEPAEPPHCSCCGARFGCTLSTWGTSACRETCCVSSLPGL